MEVKPKQTLKELQASAIKLTDKVLSDLTSGFNNDFTVEECCRYAGINKDTYYEWVKRSDEFADAMERAKTFVFLAAKRNIVGAINGKKDKDGNWVQLPSIEDSKWYLSKRQKALYADRIEATGAGGKDLISPLGLDGLSPDEKIAKIKQMIDDATKTPAA